MKTIVVGLDGSEQARAAFIEALHQAEFRQCKVLAVHVVPFPIAAGIDQAMIDPNELKNLAASALTQEMDELREHFGGEFPVTVDQKSFIGHKGQSILSSVPEEDVELYVVGSRGRGPVWSTLLGSVGTFVLHHAKRPVLVVRESTGDATTNRETKTVLVGLDGSESSRMAFGEAVNEALRLGTSLTVIHVVFVPMVMGKSFDIIDHAQLESYGQHILDQELDVLIEQYDDGFPVAISRLVRAGHIGLALEEAVADDELGVGLVVLGTRGLGGIASAFLGSVTTRAIQELPVSVLIIPKDPET